MLLGDGLAGIRLGVAKYPGPPPPPPEVGAACWAFGWLFFKGRVKAS